MRIRALLSAIGFSVFWATTGVTVRLIGDFSPLLIAAFRCLFALCLLVPVVLWQKGFRPFFAQFFSTPSQSMGLAAIMISYILTVVISYQLAPVADVVLINGASPIFVLFYKKIKGLTINKYEVWGGITALLGLFIVVLPGLFETTSSMPYKPIGLAVGLLSSLLISAYAILYYELALKGVSPDVFVLNVTIFVVGTLLFSSLYLLISRTAPIQDLSADSFALLFFLGVCSTALPTICYSMASSKLPPLITTSFRLLTPILAAGFAFLLFKEIPAASVFPGGILIILGLVLMTYLPVIKK